MTALGAAWGVTKYGSLATVFAGVVGLVVAPGLTVGATIAAGAQATAGAAATGTSWVSAKVAALASSAPVATV